MWLNNNGELDNNQINISDENKRNREQGSTSIESAKKGSYPIEKLENRRDMYLCENNATLLSFGIKNGIDKSALEKLVIYIQNNDNLDILNSSSDINEKYVLSIWDLNNGYAVKFLKNKETGSVTVNNDNNTIIDKSVIETIATVLALEDMGIWPGILSILKLIEAKKLNREIINHKNGLQDIECLVQGIMPSAVRNVYYEFREIAEKYISNNYFYTSSPEEWGMDYGDMTNWKIIIELSKLKQPIRMRTPYWMYKTFPILPVDFDKNEEFIDDLKKNFTLKEDVVLKDWQKWYRIEVDYN